MPTQKYKPFRDIWVLDREGKYIFEQRSENKIETAFIKMLFDGIDDFVHRCFEDEVSNFKLGPLFYTYLKTERFLFVGTTRTRKETKGIKPKVLKVLEDIRENVLSV